MEINEQKSSFKKSTEASPLSFVRIRQNCERENAKQEIENCRVYLQDGQSLEEKFDTFEQRR